MSLKVAKQYSRALFDAAQNVGALDAVLDDLALIINVSRESEDFGRFINLPQIPTDKKKAVIDQIFDQLKSSSDIANQKHLSLVNNFVKLLIDKGRQRELQTIFDEFSKLVRDFKGILEANVITAIPLDDDLEDALKSKLASITKKQIVLKKQVNPGIVGGAILRIKDMQIDGSVANGMLQIREKLLTT